MNEEQIVIYNSEDGEAQLDVRLENETIWLTQQQMADLFDSSRVNITEHINNVFSEGELDREATSRNFRLVQKEGKRTVNRNIDHYNLDVIISVGYRVKSKRGTQFRIWANKILKEFLVKGYSINEKRLKEKTEQLEELKKVVYLQEQVITNYILEGNEAEGLIRVIADYTTALDLLDDYDHQRLQIPETATEEVYQIQYSEAKRAIDTLGKQTNFQGLFGKEKDDSFKGSLQNIYQTFEGNDLYPSVEEKAAHLLYFVTKNHSFTDGNKRIAAFLFVWFLERNGLNKRENGTKRIPDNALVALTLMIAESHPSDKDMMIKVIVNLLIEKEGV
ncbi:MAG: cytochrome C biogenesis protein CycH [Cytophagales bacterium CG12_big_fil_rev_8_21_14_0_65_40_12]|nr:MAG: cytochrome C biogenesis protein CycH [Cytophagales bacterium CG12_big_fil_rev_8_21_14_0_65_40_12]PIW03125.1 MAG: cytochrome C biogenesis protein CycH [Cytophagales bacterium CG17_big_fil_post_rev_8_21_14_2_50_40_13]